MAVVVLASIGRRPVVVKRGGRGSGERRGQTREAEVEVQFILSASRDLDDWRGAAAGGAERQVNLERVDARDRPARVQIEWLWL